MDKQIKIYTLNVIINNIIKTLKIIKFCQHKYLFNIITDKNNKGLII